ncbi:hypothetical protein DN404_00855 [Bacillus sp. TE8-1]|nr:hypothetical protein DN404_00855 [Bacillus sp. TE8-1]
MLHPFSFVNSHFRNSISLTSKFKIFLKHTSNNENYVNELSKWMAYFIFCLAWFFSDYLNSKVTIIVKSMVVTLFTCIQCSFKLFN